MDSLEALVRTVDLIKTRPSQVVQRAPDHDTEITRAEVLRRFEIKSPTDKRSDFKHKEYQLGSNDDELLMDGEDLLISSRG